MATTPRPDRCSSCGVHISLTPEWTLWPWPDGKWLCEECNNARHELEDYTQAEQDADDNYFKFGTCWPGQ